MSSVCQQPAAQWLYTAETIAEIDMCRMKGGYAVALFYAREAPEQERTYKHYKGLLTFWMIPEKLVDDEEALEIASAGGQRLSRTILVF